MGSWKSAWGSNDSVDDGMQQQLDRDYGLVASNRVSSIIERGADDLVRRIGSTSVVFDETYFRIGDAYCRVIYLDGWPHEVPPNWLAAILQWPRAMDVTIHYNPQDDGPIKSKLRGKIARLKAQLDADELAGETRDSEMEQEWEDASDLLDLFQRGRTKPISVSLQIMVRGETLAELNRLTEQIEKTFAGMGASCRAVELRQRDAFLSVLPFGRNYIADGMTARNMHTQAAMYTFPLANADLTHPKGVWYGVNMMTNSNVILDRFQLNSPHAIVLGGSGSGKSYGMKQEQIRVRMRGGPVIVIDPEGETERMCHDLGGQFITIAPNSPDRINCMDFSGVADGVEDQLTVKIASVLKLIGNMMNPGGQGYGLGSEQVQLLEMLMRSMYQEFGYTQDPRTQLPRHAGGYCDRDRMPILSDFRARLQQYMDDNAHDLRIRELLGPVIASLGPYCAGGLYSSLFDQKTTVDLRADYIAFNIRGLTRDEHLMSLGMFNVLDFIWNSVMTREQMLSHTPKYLYIDEAHIMMRSPESAEFLEQLLRRARKFNVACTVLSQSPEDFVRPDRPQGRAIFDNSSMQIVMRMQLRALEMLQDLLGLDDSEVDLLANAQKGEGMIFAQNDRAWVSMRTSSPREHMMITTNPDEVRQIEEWNAEQERQQIEAPTLALPQPRQPEPAPAAQEPRRPQIRRPEPVSQIGGDRPATGGLRQAGPPKPLNPQPQPQREWRSSGAQQQPPGHGQPPAGGRGDLLAHRRK